MRDYRLVNTNDLPNERLFAVYSEGGKAIEVWIEDNNLWFAFDGCSVILSFPNAEEAMNFHAYAVRCNRLQFLNEELSFKIGDTEVIIEPEDSGRRNMNFRLGNLNVMVNLSLNDFPELGKFVKRHIVSE